MSGPKHLMLLSILVSGCGGASANKESQSSASQSAATEQANKAGPNKAAKKKSQTRPSWPNWLGPKFDGISRETEWRQSWTEPPKILWRSEVGIGYSSTAIAHDRLYTLGHRDGQETIYCLNALTGKPVWSRTYPCELVDNLNAGGPGATPTLDGEFVYTNSRGGEVFCLQAKDGKVVWKKQLRKELEIELPEWGFTCSPLVLNDWLILDASRVIALDKKTGNRVWQSGEHSPGYGTPTVFKHQGQTLIASLNCDGLLVVKAKNGEEVASYPWDSPFATNSTTPIVRNDTIFVSTGYNKGCVLLKLKAGQLKPVYQTRKMRNHFNNSVLLNGKLYGFDGNSNLGGIVKLVCLDYQTGKVDWIQRGFGCGSLLIADNKLIILSDEGKLVIADATPREFKERASVQVLDGECWTVPVLAGGLVYCRSSEGRLVCVNLRKTK